MAAGTISSNLYTSGQQQQSIYPGTRHEVLGSIVIPANTSFATTDILKLMQFPGPASFIDGFWIDLPGLDGGAGLTLSLVDTLTSPTTIVSASTAGQAGGWISQVNAVHGTVGSAANAGAGYVSGVELRLIPAHASTNTTGAAALTIYFGVGISNS